MIDLHVYLYFLSLSCDVNKKWIGFMAQQALILLVDEIGYKKKVYNVSTSIFLYKNIQLDTFFQVYLFLLK